jgi:hypothetical protein
MEYTIVLVQPPGPSGIDRREMLRELLLEAELVKAEAIVAFSDALVGQEALVVAQEVPEDPERRVWDWLDHAFSLHLISHMTRLWSVADLTRSAPDT